MNEDQTGSDGDLWWPFFLPRPLSVPGLGKSVGLCVSPPEVASLLLNVEMNPSTWPESKGDEGFAVDTGTPKAPLI